MRIGFRKTLLTRLFIAVGCTAKETGIAVKLVISAFLLDPRESRYICFHPREQWRRSVIKYDGRVSHQAVSDYTLRQRFPNTQQLRFLTACRRLEKLVFTQVFHP